MLKKLKETFKEIDFVVYAVKNGILSKKLIVIVAEKYDSDWNYITR